MQVGAELHCCEFYNKERRMMGTASAYKSLSQAMSDMHAANKTGNRQP